MGTDPIYRATGFDGNPTPHNMGGASYPSRRTAQHIQSPILAGTASSRSSSATVLGHVPDRRTIVDNQDHREPTQYGCWKQGCTVSLAQLRSLAEGLDTGRTGPIAIERAQGRTIPTPRIQAR